MKITGFTTSNDGGDPNDESISVLLRKAASLEGCRLQYYNLPSLTQQLPNLPTMLQDRFAMNNLDGWAFIDEENRGNVHSSWRVEVGELRMTPDGNGNNALAELTTYALCGDLSWSDFRLSVRLRSDVDGAIGVIFRFRDAYMHDRFSMDRRVNKQRKYRRLTKSVNGIITVLWQDNVRYATKQYYDVVIDCIGEVILGYVNSVLVFAVKDASVSSGEIGLYCYANTDARFSEVRVFSPAWETFYNFDNEELLPAGTQIRVFSGNESNPHPEEKEATFRFAASSDNPGKAKLPTDKPIILRIIDIYQKVGHTQFFQREAAYAKLDPKVLRKADGTNFRVQNTGASPYGSTFETGQYKLKFTYQRDNNSYDPTSIVLSQAGKRNPEVCTINIPWHTQN